MGPYLLTLQENRSLTIKLRKRKPEKKVEWTSDTVDNEHMGRRSSKCECCCPSSPHHCLPDLYGSLYFLGKENRWG